MASAHNYREYEDMLKMFRCQDLANLLAYAGQSKNGKKTELYERSIALLRKGNPNVQLKIKEIHTNRTMATNAVSTTGGVPHPSMNPASMNFNIISHLVSSNSNSSSTTSNSPDPNIMFNSAANSLPPSGNTRFSVQQAMFNPYGSYNNLPPGVSSRAPIMNSYVPTTGINGLHSHVNSHSVLIKIEFEKLAFFEFVNEILTPFRLLAQMPNQRPFLQSFTFVLNQEQVNDVIGNRTMIDGKYEFGKQIHLRFGFYDRAEQKDVLPANLNVIVNGKPAALPTPKPTSKPNADIIRPGRSIDISPCIKLAPNMQNRVEIQWTNLDPNKTHCVGVYLFKRISVATLLSRLTSKSIIEPDETRRMVREKLSIADSDFLIETTTLKVALLCPLMKCRIHFPARGRQCKHVQCFDLESYLLMNEKKPGWLCPVCDGPAPYESLIIDGLFKSILEKEKTTEEIEFTPDGEWTKVGSKPDKKSSKPTPAAATFTGDEICCDDPSPNNSITTPTTAPDPLLNGHSSEKTAEIPPPPQPQPPAKNADVIDLTLDSDSDSDTAPARARLLPPRTTSTSSSTSSITYSRSNGSVNPPQKSSSHTSLSGGTSRSVASNQLLPQQPLVNDQLIAQMIEFAAAEMRPQQMDFDNLDPNQTRRETLDSSPSTPSVISLGSSDDEESVETVRPAPPPQPPAAAEPARTTITNQTQPDLPRPTNSGSLSSSSSSQRSSSGSASSAARTVNTPPPISNPAATDMSGNSKLARDLSAPSPPPPSNQSSPSLLNNPNRSVNQQTPPSKLNNNQPAVQNSRQVSPRHPTAQPNTTSSSTSSSSSATHQPKQPSVSTDSNVNSNNARASQPSAQPNRPPQPPQPVRRPTQPQSQPNPTNPASKPNPYGIVNPNSRVNSHQHSRPPEYLNKEKAIRMHEQLKSAMTSNGSGSSMEVDTLPNGALNFNLRDDRVNGQYRKQEPQIQRPPGQRPGPPPMQNQSQFRMPGPYTREPQMNPRPNQPPPQNRPGGHQTPGKYPPNHLSPAKTSPPSSSAQYQSYMNKQQQQQMSNRPPPVSPNHHNRHNLTNRPVASSTPTQPHSNLRPFNSQQAIHSQSYNSFSSHQHPAQSQSNFHNHNQMQPPPHHHHQYSSGSSSSSTSSSVHNNR